MYGDCKYWYTEFNSKDDFKTAWLKLLIRVHLKVVLWNLTVQQISTRQNNQYGHACIFHHQHKILIKHWALASVMEMKPPIHLQNIRFKAK